MLWVEHTFVAMLIARWLWRVGSWFAAVHAENMRRAELMLEARLNAEIINRGAAQRRENKKDALQSEARQSNRGEWNWNQMKGKVKENWGSPTDDEIDKIEGRRDQLEGKIQERYGCTRDIACKDIGRLLHVHPNRVGFVLPIAIGPAVIALNSGASLSWSSVTF